MDDLISRQTPIEARRYTFGNDEFNLEYAYHDCKLVFDGITDDDSFQKADTGLILYYANEIIYALQEALEGKDTNVPTNDCISRQDAIDLIEDIETKRLKGEIGLMYAPAIKGLNALPSVQSKNEERMEKSAQYVPNDDLISRKAAIKALLELVEARRTWVSIEDARKEISGIDASMCAIHDLPSVQPTISGYDIRHLELIASVLQKENLPPERVTEALIDIGRIVAIVKEEFEESLRKAVEQCTI